MGKPDLVEGLASGPPVAEVGKRRRVGTTRRFRLSGYRFNSVRSARKLGVFYAGYSIMKLTSNTILITGGGSGIGYEITKQLTALGNTILVTGRDQSKIDRAKSAFTQIHIFQNGVFDSQTNATLYAQVNQPLPHLTNF